MEKRLLIYVGGLMSLALVFSLTACEAGKSEGDRILELEKEKIVRKVRVLLDEVNPKTVREINRILDKVKPELVRVFCTNRLLDRVKSACHPGARVLLTGQHLPTWFEPEDWDTVKIIVVETPKPYQVEGMYEFDSSKGSVGDTTQGTLTLSYTDVNGQPVKVKRSIEIDNRTRVISYGGSTVTLLKDIFEPLPFPLGKKTVTLFMDFEYWVTISLATQ